MSKADRDRQALLQRLAREQRRALNAAARDADRARTPTSPIIDPTNLQDRPCPRCPRPPPPVFFLS